MKTAGVKGAVGSSMAHDSAHLHVTGEALYIDDLPEPQGLLHAAIGISSQAHARLTSLQLTPVRKAPGVVAVIAAGDIPGINDYGAIIADDPIFADARVEYVGQAIFAVAARTVQQARRAARLAVIDYERLPAILTPEAARDQASFVLPTETLTRGNATEALALAPHRLQGILNIGGQDQFYLEGQIALAVPQEDGAFLIYSSTQYPSEVQQKVAHALGLAAHRVTVVCRRMGGGFGGKESQPALFACLAALLAAKTKRPVKLRLDRDDDMIMTGKRHDFVATYDVGFDDCGQLQGLALELASRCGMSADLSGPVNDRAMFHCDNCYYLPHVAITSHRCKTHTVSNTAFRGFGGPQGMMVIEYVIDEVARYLGVDPLEVRKRNFYGIGERDITPYAMRVEDNIIEALVTELECRADYQTRRREIESFNAANPVLKRGIALTPVKFGIAFTATHLNQAGALLHVYTDGSVQLNHGGTEMGQGLFIKVAQVVAEELQIDIDRITTTATNTSKVPNASATAASSGSDLNGKAAQAAACTIKARLTAFAAEHFQLSPDQVSFRNNRVYLGEESISFAELVELAYGARVSLSATGFFRTPNLHYDRATFSGRPFLYFAYGAAVSEVMIDTLTGEYQVLRVDMLHDVGNSLNPAIDRGQIEGGFLQGMGWLTSEELWWDADGALQTHAPSTYKIPTCHDWPADVRLSFFKAGGNREDTIYRSKAVGEPPLMLAISVFHALKEAIASVAEDRMSPHLNAPATPEAVLMAIEAVKCRSAKMRSS
jgi:xanthine dehydrogenase large subunit